MVPDWPKPGVDFLDMSAVLEIPEAFGYCTEQLCLAVTQSAATSVVALESRGFLFAAAVASKLSLPLVLIRKAGKLPGPTYSTVYQTEYSQDVIAIKQTAKPGSRPFVIDDLLATGGTINAAARLLRNNFDVETVTAGVVANLTFLAGAKSLQDNKISLVSVLDYA